MLIILGESIGKAMSVFSAHINKPFKGIIW